MTSTTGFTTLKRSTIPVTDLNTDTTWDIRDDYPMDVAVQFIDIQAKLKDYQELASAGDAEAAKALILESDQMSAEFILAIFQHSYPEMTLDEIKEHFAYEDRMNLGALFFTLRMNRFSQPHNAQAVAVAEQLASKTMPTRGKTRR